MSVEYYMVCVECKKALHVAQDGLSGFTFYSGQPETMKLLSAFLDQHGTFCEAGSVQFLSDGDGIIDEDDAYEVRDSHGNVLPND